MGDPTNLMKCRDDLPEWKEKSGALGQKFLNSVFKTFFGKMMSKNMMCGVSGLLCLISIEQIIPKAALASLK